MLSNIKHSRKFSWKGFEKHRMLLIRCALVAAKLEKDIDAEKIKGNCTFDKIVRGLHQQPTDDIRFQQIGFCLRSIHRIQHDLIKHHGLDWGFVHRQSSIILNPSDENIAFLNRMVYNRMNK